MRLVTLKYSRRCFRLYYVNITINFPQSAVTLASIMRSWKDVIQIVLLSQRAHPKLAKYTEREFPPVPLCVRPLGHNRTQTRGTGATQSPPSVLLTPLACSQVPLHISRSDTHRKCICEAIEDQNCRKSQTKYHNKLLIKIKSSPYSF